MTSEVVLQIAKWGKIHSQKYLLFSHPQGILLYKSTPYYGTITRDKARKFKYVEFPHCCPKLIAYFYLKKVEKAAGLRFVLVSEKDFILAEMQKLSQ